MIDAFKRARARGVPLIGITTADQPGTFAQLAQAIKPEHSGRSSLISLTAPSGKLSGGSIRAALGLRGRGRPISAGQAPRSVIAATSPTAAACR